MENMRAPKRGRAWQGGEGRGAKCRIRAIMVDHVVKADI